MKILRSFCACFVALACTSVAPAANDIWDANGLIPPSGLWGTNANWADNTTPGNSDTATFNLAGSYTTAFNANPLAIQALTVTAGTAPTFASSGGARTLLVNSATGGQDVTINGGSKLSLGTSGNPLHLTVGDNLTVNGSSDLNINFGSQVNTLDLLLATVNGGGNGTVAVDGVGSRLNVTNDFNLAQNGNVGTLTYRNGAQGTFSGTVNLAASSNPATAATLNVVSNSRVDTASLNVGNGGGTGTGTLNINGPSVLVLSGTSTLNVGTASACFGNINIGTTTTGGGLTMGTGTLTINNTGTVTIGSGVNTGTLNANGNVTNNGGTLTRGNGSTFNLANGKTFTIQNGGDADFIGSYDITDATYLVTGAGSAWTITSSVNVFADGTLTIENGGEMSVNSIASIGAGGNVTVSGAGSTWSNGSTLSVGGAFFGTLTINGGGAVSSFGGHVGPAGGIGRVTVTGAGSTWTNSGELVVGTSATGGFSSRLTIEAGGSVSNADAYIGYNNDSAGMVTVTGASANWNNNSALFVGNAGTGTLLIESGGSVSNTDGFIGFIRSTGTVTVTGTGSTWNSSGSAFVGGTSSAAGGVGTLTVETGGMINVGSQLKLWDDATINLSGGTINVENLANSGGTFNFNRGTLAVTGAGGIVIGGSGPLGSSLTLTAGQTLSVVNTATIDNGSSLTLNGGTLNVGNLAGGGAIVLHSGTLNLMSANLTVGVGSTFGTTMFIGSAQAVNVTNQATVDADAEMVVAGSLNSSSLTNNGDLVALDATIDGPVVNNNAITVVGTVDFNGLVSGPGDFFGPGTANFNGGMAPGASPAAVSFEGGLGLADTNTLFIEIGGSTPGSQYDRLTIAGSASLDGILDVSLINGFTPSGGQQFTILTAGSIVNNGFVLGGPAASSFSLLVNNTSMILQAISAGVPGDYNNDGTVDAADYVVWRKTGINGPTGYDTWRTNFGEPGGTGSGAGANAAIPEPATLVLLMFAAAVGIRLRRRDIA